ncbi:MAG: hypothetical protein KBC53_03490 [Nitrosomonas sp.]|nr:hypothetical protein [Nitrosomonas sp.]
MVEDMVKPYGMEESDDSVETVDQEALNKAQAEAFISIWLDKIDKARKQYSKNFKRMGRNMRIASGYMWPDQKEEDDRYVANIAHNIIRQMAAALYAKNPTVIAKRNDRMYFSVWDENPESLMTAQQQMKTAMAQMMPIPPAAQAIIDDVVAGTLQKEKLDKICRTLEIVFKHQLGEQQPDFKRMMKQLVIRVLTCGIGYLKLDFQRVMDVNPDTESRINDIAQQLSHIESLESEMEENEGDKDARSEELRIALKTLEENKYVMVREGLLFHFPRSTAIIPDPSCTQLEGFLGANWVAEEYYLSCEEIERIYKVDVGGSGKAYSRSESTSGDYYRPVMMKEANDKSDSLYCVYEIYDRLTGSCFTICDGYTSGYLREPKAPNVQVEQFFPYYPIAFNQKEDEASIFPLSVVDLLYHQLMEYNRSKESLRQHRIAMKPLYVSGTGALSEADKGNIASHSAHDCIELQNLQVGQKAEDLFSMVRKHGIDPNVYETGTIFEDMSRIVGFQDANLGAVSGATATETSIAEDNRMSGVASNIDDLDDFLTMVVKEAGKVLLTELSEETVKYIAGDGAVWPDLTREEIIDDLYLEIEAGSSGRPNKTQQAASLERLYPLLIQLPGIKPEWLARQAVKVSGDNIDISEAFASGLPSIIAINSQFKANGMAGSSDPAMQGMEGANNQEQPLDSGGGSQAGMDVIQYGADGNRVM